MAVRVRWRFRALLLVGVAGAVLWQSRFRALPIVAVLVLSRSSSAVLMHVVAVATTTRSEPGSRSKRHRMNHLTALVFQFRPCPSGFFCSISISTWTLDGKSMWPTRPAMWSLPWISSRREYTV